MRMKMRFKKQLAGIAATAAISAAMLVPAVAQAGSMTYWSCRSGPGVPTSTEGWSSSGTWAWSSINNSCGSGGALSLHGTSTNADIPANSAPMMWSYRAPANTTIGSVQLASYGDLAGTIDVNASMGMSVYRGDPIFDSAHLADNCQVFLQACMSWPLAWRNYGIGDTQFHFGIWCGGSPGGYCHKGILYQKQYRAYLEVRQAGIELVDSSAPVAGSVGGSALEARPLKGTEALTVPMTDQGVGLATYEVRLGGVTLVPRQGLSGNPGTCAEIDGGGYPAPVPCRLAATTGIQVDTTRVPEGAAQLKVTVWDAAGNASDVVDRRVTIDNIAPPLLDPKVQPVKVIGDIRVGRPANAQDGHWVGNGRTVAITRRWQTSTDGSAWATLPATGSVFTPGADLEGKWLRIEVTATSVEGSTVAYSDAVKVQPPQSASDVKVDDGPAGQQLSQLVANNGSGGSPASGRLVASSKAEVIRVRYKRKATIAGKLVDERGAAITGAELDVYEQLASAGASRVKVGTVVTDGQGRYVVHPSSAASRAVEISFSRERGATLYQSTHRITLQVRPGLRLRLVRQHIPAFGTMTLRGRVLLGAPLKGTLVQIKAGDGRRWLTTDVVRTDSKGRFRWTHKFKKVASGRVKFRAEIKKTPTLPGLTNTSRAVTVRIG